MTGRHDPWIILFSTIGSLLLLNVLAADHFVRVDLTRNGAFTLSKASRATVRDLEDPVTITAYFSRDLPPQFETHKRYVRDLLEEYRAASKGMVSFEIIDPRAQESDEDRERKKAVRRDIFGRRVREKTSVELELERLGVRPVEIRVIEDDAAQTKRGYLGIVIRYREETEVIPVVQNTARIEYDITTLTRKLTRTKIPVLALAQGRGEPTPTEELGRLNQLISQNYELRPLELAGIERIDPDIDALLIVGPSEAYGEAELRAIDQFLMQGRSAAFLLDRVSVDMQTFQPTPVEHGLDALLASYGIEIGRQLVADVECASFNVAERRGFMVVSLPVKYPFIPQPRILEGDSPITRGLTDTMIPFVAPLTLNEREGVELLALASSSEKSWLESADAFSLDPRRDWAAARVEVSGPYTLIAQASGELPSHFAAEAVIDPNGGTGNGILPRAITEARIVVAGTSAIARDTFLSPSNSALMLNIVDWMLLDPALLEMRTRTLAASPIDPDLAPATRNLVKYGNVIGVPALLILYGLLRRILRERRRARIVLAQATGAGA